MLARHKPARWDIKHQELSVTTVTAVYLEKLRVMEAENASLDDAKFCLRNYLRRWG